MLLALSKTSMNYLKQLLDSQDHLTMIFFPKQNLNGHVHLRARPHSGALSYGFGIMFQTGGKPSTGFPPVKLVELYFPSDRALHDFNSMKIYFM